MGFALPAAIGAQIARRDDQVWVTVGDGGFQMNIQELATVVQEQLPIKIAVLNNGYLGMVRQWQQLFFESRYSGTPLLGPDFAKVADAYGIASLTVREKADVVPSIEKALAIKGPALIDFRVEQEENVYPMVAPGAPVHDMIRRPVGTQGSQKKEE
jgi:acetolactate synthase-1/2/3 large subunit